MVCQTRIPMFCVSLVLLPVLAFAQTTPGLFLEPPPPLVPVVSLDVPVEKNPPVVLGADGVGYDQENGVVVARGNVELQQGNRTLLADQVTYYQKRDTVIAEGNVVMMQPTGDVFFSDRAELNDALKVGAIHAFKARMSDNSVLVAERAVRTSPSNTTLTKAEYTPCNLCEGRSPFWQLNAKEAKLDQLAEKVTYQDATFNIHGVPVFYTPTLSHPTPDAPAKSGLLPAQYGANGNLGTLLKVPYYWRIDHDKEATITPWYSTTAGPVLEGTYQQLRDAGEINVHASGTYPDKLDGSGGTTGGNEFRGHVFAKAYQTVGDYSRVGFDVERASDDTFLRRYALGDQRVLFSRLYAESAFNRNYAVAQGLAMQGLRVTDNHKTTPLVLPMLQGYYETTPDEHGIRYNVSGDLQALSRSEGVDQQRISTTVGASLPYVTDGGHVLTTSATLRQDLYATDNLTTNGVTNTNSTSNYRVVPQAALEWRYPLAKQLGGDSMVVEPLVLTVLQPHGSNPSTISNEDSRLLELTDTNLFSINRMPGLDSVDSGSRVAYGARGQYLFREGTAVDALIGQNYNPSSKTPFPNSTNPNENFSDYIGRLAFNYAPVNLAYRFAADKGSFHFNRNELSAQFSKPWLSFSTSYRSISNNRFINDSEEGDVNVTLPLTENWSIYGGARRNFTIDQLVSASSGVVFKNECFNLGLDTVRIYTRDRDVEPTTQFLLRVAFKNLGEFGG